MNTYRQIKYTDGASLATPISSVKPVEQSETKQTIAQRPQLADILKSDADRVLGSTVSVGVGATSTHRDDDEDLTFADREFNNLYIQ